MVWKRKLDNETIEQRVNEYFEYCSNSTDTRELKNGDVRIRKENPSMVGLAVWLDVDKSLLYEYIDGRYTTESNKTIVDSLTRARQRIESETLQRATDGDMPPQVAAMLLSTYGYNQPQETKDITIRIESGGLEWGK